MNVKEVEYVFGRREKQGEKRNIREAEDDNSHPNENKVRAENSMSLTQISFDGSQLISLLQWLLTEIRWVSFNWSRVSRTNRTAIENIFSTERTKEYKIKVKTYCE